MTVTPGKGVAAKPSYYWNSKATPAIKKQLIEDYNKEHGVTTAKTSDPLGIL
jgi:hypothetical protein